MSGLPATRITDTSVDIISKDLKVKYIYYNGEYLTFTTDFGDLIIVTGLSPNTDYVARIIFEDGHSDYSIFKTTGTSSCGSYGISASSSTSSSVTFALPASFTDATNIAISGIDTTRITANGLDVTVGQLACGVTDSFLVTKNDCVAKVTYSTVQCGAHTNVSPVMLKLTKLNCKTFVCSWTYDKNGVLPDTVTIVVTDSTGSILFKSTSWDSSTTTFDSVDYLKLLLLDRITFQIYTSETQYQMVDFVVPECQSGDCPKEKHKRNILSILFLFISLIIVINLLLRQLIPNTFSV